MLTDNPTTSHPQILSVQPAMQSDDDPLRVPIDSAAGESQPAQGELFETAPPPWELAVEDDVAIACVVFSEAPDGPYDYRIPDALREQLQAGMRVRVPLGRRRKLITGWCTETKLGSSASRSLRRCRGSLGRRTTLRSAAGPSGSVDGTLLFGTGRTGFRRAHSLKCPCCCGDSRADLLFACQAVAKRSCDRRSTRQATSGRQIPGRGWTTVDRVSIASRSGLYEGPDQATAQKGIDHRRSPPRNVGRHASTLAVGGWRKRTVDFLDG